MEKIRWRVCTYGPLVVYGTKRGEVGLCQCGMKI